MPQQSTFDNSGGFFESGKNPYLPSSNLYKSPIFSLHGKPRTGEPTPKIEYVNIFNTKDGSTALYRIRRGFAGVGVFDLRKEDRIAIRTSDGKYEPEEYGKKILDEKNPILGSVMENLVNDASTISEVEKNTRFNYISGYKAENPNEAAKKSQAELNAQADAILQTTPETELEVIPSVDDSNTTTLTSSGIVDGISANSNFNSGDLRYPLGVPNNIEVDYIKFSALKYAPATINTTNFGISSGRNEVIGESVYLPIQGQISDTNGVGWNEETINPLQIAGAGIANGTITGGGGEGATRIQNLLNSAIGNNAELKQAVKGAAINAAIGANFLPREQRAIFNPNTELLFNGPQLRAFNFTFKLTPRNEPEAKNIKNIIRFFKINMAAQTTSGEIFLKAPNVFRVEYLLGNDAGNHQGLNLIKDCGLQSFAVDYTPDGSYMTVGKNGSMFSYSLTMSFMELLPIYAKDYNENEAANHPIGY